MKKVSHFFGIVLFLFFGISGFTQQEKYARIRIYPEENTTQLLSGMGIPFEGKYRKDPFLTSEIPVNILTELDRVNIKYEVLIEDVTAYYIERNIPFRNLEINRDPSDEYPVPQGWEYGSMGGFYTLSQVLEELDSMFMLYPELITPRLQMDSNSIEGRPVYWVKISDNPNINEDEPEVLYTAIHHAREVIGVQQMIYFMYYLLENYNTDDEIYYLVNSTEMYFVPCLNPDGYVFNELTNPNGGGMWRKNRRNNGGGDWGVDLNRNYGFEWGYDNFGSSPDPWEETYRGTAPFSEPEAQAIRQFCIDNEFTIALHYHSYGNKFLYPWGYVNEPSPDDQLLETYAEIMTIENNYEYGRSNPTYSPTNGNSDDWMYGETNEKESILSFTPEVGKSNDGFWPAIIRIIPLCQENMYQNIMAAKLAGKYASLTNLNPVVTSELSGYFRFALKRLGQAPADFTVTVIPLSDNIVEVGNPKVYSGLAILDMVEDSISYQLIESIVPGEEIQYKIAVSNGIFTEEITVSGIYGPLVTLFNDEGNDMENWNGIWDITGEDYISPPHSITDSPESDYENNSLKSITLGQYIHLDNTVYAEMTFWTKWDIEEDHDYAQVLISTNGGIDWIPLEGRYTDTGTQYQAEGEPVYDGMMNAWTLEYFDLSEYIDKTIRLRFLLKSDGYHTGDGFYFDNLKVSVIDETTANDEFITVKESMMFKPYPNPANSFVRIDLNNLNQYITSLSVKFYNSTGQMVFMHWINKDETQLVINVSKWNQGIYYYSVSDNNSNNYTGKLIVH